MTQKAYYWYRPHPYFDEFYSGKVLNLIVDKEIIAKYLPDPEHQALVQKYFPDGLSPHGLSMLMSVRQYSTHGWEAITEIIFELVRQLHFPESPSRLTSLYASMSRADSVKWAQLWYHHFQDITGQVAHELWEIEFDSDVRLYDASLLALSTDDHSNDFSYLHALENAHRYWRREFSSNPIPELIIPYPVTVRRLCRDMISEGK